MSGLCIWAPGVACGARALVLQVTHYVGSSAARPGRAAHVGARPDGKQALIFGYILKGVNDSWIYNGARTGRRRRSRLCWPRLVPHGIGRSCPNGTLRRLEHTIDKVEELERSPSTLLP